MGWNLFKPVWEMTLMGGPKLGTVLEEWNRTWNCGNGNGVGKMNLSVIVVGVTVCQFRKVNGLSGTSKATHIHI